MTIKKIPVAAVIALLMCFNASSAQTDSARIKSLIYDHVHKNIASYYISYKQKRNSDLNKDKFLTAGISLYFFDRCLPDDGYKLRMEITKLDWQYPVKNYIVYQVHINGFYFESLTGGKDISFQSYDGSPNAPPGNYFLLCIDSKDNIKYISGSYFLHDVSEDFELNRQKPDSYLEYIKYKTFQFQTRHISYLTRKGSYFYYSASSNELKRNVQVTLNPKSPSHLNIRVLKE